MPARGYRRGARAAIAALGIPADLATYLPDLPERLAWAHLVIARAGASTIAELTAAGRPAILVPLPSATDDHQTANAREMAEAGGARTIAQAHFTAVELAKQMQKLGARTRGARQRRRARARACGRPDAARDLADLVEGFGAARDGRDRRRCARLQGERARFAEALRMKGVAHRYRHDPFRRHRRHRHVRASPR